MEPSRATGSKAWAGLVACSCFGKLLRATRRRHDQRPFRTMCDRSHRQELQLPAICRQRVFDVATNGVIVRLRVDLVLDLDTALSTAHLAPSGVDSLAWLRWLFDYLNARSVTGFAFDFDFTGQVVSLSRLRMGWPPGSLGRLAGGRAEAF